VDNDHQWVCYMFFLGFWGGGGNGGSDDKEIARDGTGYVRNLLDEPHECKKKLF
jgi:hypothetical protein